MPASNSIKRIIFSILFMCTFKSALSIRRKTEMPGVASFCGCNHHTVTAVASCLPEQGVCVNSVLGQGPTCANSHRKEREQLTVLAGQE